MRDARLSTWRTTGGVEVDFIVESPHGLVAIEVKSGCTLRPKDRRGLLAFHDEFPEARLIARTDSPLQAVKGRSPCGRFRRSCRNWCLAR